MAEPKVTSRRATRGRPSRQEAMLLRTRILASALREFLQRGYAGSSIDGIAKEAGVSRTTVYALYSDKLTLFNEMLRQYVTGADIAQQVELDDRPPAVVLNEAMRALNRLYYHGPNLAILRLCIAEADRFPEIFEGVHDILSSTLHGLVGYFERLRDADCLVIEDCGMAARLFNMLSLGALRPFLSSPDAISEGERSDHIDMAVTIFLRGILRDCPDPNSRAEF